MVAGGRRPAHEGAPTGPGRPPAKPAAGNRGPPARRAGRHQSAGIRSNLQSMKLEELAFVNQQLAGMLKSGIPLEGALRQLCANMRRGQLRVELEALEAD